MRTPTTRSLEAFDRIGGFDERLYAAEELAFSRAIKRVGRLVLVEPAVVTSARKFRTHSFAELARMGLGSLQLTGAPSARVSGWRLGMANAGTTQVLRDTDAASMTKLNRRTLLHLGSLGGAYAAAAATRDPGRFAERIAGPRRRRGLGGAVDR